MLSVQGIYTDGTVVINEPVPVNKEYDVIITFLKPSEQAKNDITRDMKIAALNRITGVLSDNAITLEEAREQRLARQ